MIARAHGLIDLHVHTTYSDGVLTPEAVVRRAKSLGIGTLAITDHDSMLGVTEAQAAGSELDVFVLPGVELSTHFRENEVHLLGYFATLDHAQSLAALCEKLLASRRDRLCGMIEALRHEGVELDPAEVLPAPPASPARPHLARALIEGGHASSIREVYERWIGPHCDAYVGKTRVELHRAVSAIHDAGGVAVLAHPGKRYSEPELDEFTAQGLDGIEAYHARQPKRISKRLRGYAMARGLLITGGSDFHGSVNGQHGLDLGASTQPHDDFEALAEALARRSGSCEALAAVVAAADTDGA